MHACVHVSGCMCVFDCGYMRVHSLCMCIIYVSLVCICTCMCGALHVYVITLYLYAFISDYVVHWRFPVFLVIGILLFLWAPNLCR